MGKDVIIVSSGACGIGHQRLKAELMKKLTIQGIYRGDSEQTIESAVSRGKGRGGNLGGWHSFFLKIYKNNTAAVVDRERELCRRQHLWGSLGSCPSTTLCLATSTLCVHSFW